VWAVRFTEAARAELSTRKIGTRLIVVAVEKLSDEPFPYGFQKLTGAAHTPHKNGAKRKLTEIRLAGLLEHRGASQQTKRRKIPAKEEAFHRRNT